MLDGQLMSEELARRVQRVAHLSGEFRLRSGQIATDYFDKYRFEADPAIIDAVARGMANLVPAETEVLAGLEMGGIPLVTMVSHYTGIPAAFVRKQAKPYGTCRLAEGAEVDGRQVLVVEDVVTSGGQIAISSQQLRELGARIDYALCAIDRSEGGMAALSDIGVTLISLYSRDDLERAAST